MDTTRPSLLLRIRDRGDAVAWREFDALYRPLLERYARARGLSPESAEDVAQHCLTQLCSHIDEFTYDPAKGRFKSWLRTLVNNRVRNLVRDGHEQPLAAGEPATPADREPAPEEIFDRIWLQEHLWHCLRQLREEVEPVTYRAFLAYVIEQQPVEQVSRELGLTPQNVYTIKWRVTERVAAKMRELVDAAD